MISLDDLKTALRISGTAQDSYLTGLEAAAVAYVERFTHRSFGATGDVTEFVEATGSAELWLEEAPTALPVSVTERVGPGADGSTITAADANGYVLRGSRLVRKAGGVWACGYEYEVTYERGYGAGSEPADIRWAVQTIVTHWYERRVPLPRVGEVHTFPVPHHVDGVLQTWRRMPV